MENKKYSVISLSGGLDSSSLLLRLLREGYDVTALSFDYGQKHKVELERATKLVSYLNAQFYKIGDKYGKIKHQIIRLDGLSNLLNSSLVSGGSEVPEGHYEQDNMKATVVPIAITHSVSFFSAILNATAWIIDENILFLLGTTVAFILSCS